MIPIFYHLVIEIVSRFKASITNGTRLSGSHLLEQRLGNILLKCQERYILAELQASALSTQNNNNNNNEVVNSSQKILNSYFEASISWSLIAELTILKNSGSVSLIEIDTLRSNVFNLLEIIPTKGTIQNITDMVSLFIFYLFIDFIDFIEFFYFKLFLFLLFLVVASC